MPDVFAQMHQRLFARLGEQAVLRGSDACTVVLSHGVAITGEEGELIGYRDIAEVLISDKPKVGDTLTIDGTQYVIDSVLKHNGYSSRCILR